MIKNYECIDIDTSLTEDQVVDIAKDILSEFSWRRGDSDMVGRYLSGYDKYGVKLKIWFDNRPYEMAVSFPSKGLEDLEKLKLDTMGKIKNKFIEKITN